MLALHSAAIVLGVAGLSGGSPALEAPRLDVQGMFAPRASAAGASSGRLLPRDVSLRGGLGFTGDPSTFLLALEGSYAVTRTFSLGPLFQLGIDDDDFIFAPSLNARLTLPDPGIARLKLFAQGGLGLALIDKERNGDDDEVGFLMNFGGGVDYFLDDRTSIGSSILFNVLPDEVMDEYFFFSWQVVTLSFHF